MTGKDQVAQQQVMYGIANDLENELVRTCPVDKGFLKLSIKVRVEGKKLIISMLEYGKYVEYGTAPHIIKTKSKKVLTNQSTASKGKEAFFGKEVRHPGTRPNPFIRAAIMTKLPGIIKKNIRRHL